MTGVREVNRKNYISALENMENAEADGKKISAQSRPPVLNQNDSVYLSEDGKSVIERKAAAKKWISELGNQYGNISVSFTGKNHSYSLKKMAAEMGKGTHLILSQKFLDRMSSSEEAFKECQDVLSEVMEQLSQASGYEYASGAFIDAGEVKFWSVSAVKDKRKDDLEMLLEYQKRQEEAKAKKSGGAKDTRYSANSEDYNTAGKYARLAGAGNPSSVRQVMSEAQQSIGKLRLMSCLGDKEESLKARMAIRSLQKLLLRGRKKLTRLNDEALCEARRKRAEERKELEREQKIAMELKKKRNARRSADKAIAAEGKLDDANMEWRRKAYHDSNQLAENLGIALNAGTDSGSFETAEPSGAPGGAITPSEVTISESIQF